MYQPDQSAAACPGEVQLQAKVVARLGYDPFVETASLTLRATVAAGTDGLVAVITLERDSGGPPRTRQLASRGEDCVELAESIALALAIAIDPLSPMRASAPLPAEATPPPTTTAPPARRFASLKVSPALNIGLAPSPTLALSLGAAIGWPSFAIGLEASAGLTLSASLAGRAVRSGAFTGSLVPCFLWGRFSGCGVIALGVLWSRADGITAPATALTLIAAAGPRLAVDFSLTEAVAIVAWAELWARLVRTSLRLNDAEVWGSPPVSGAGGVALKVSLW